MTVKKEAERDARNNCGPLSALDYTVMMNTRNHSDTYAFAFPTINRGIGVFPEKLKDMKGVRKFCDLQYTHADETGACSEHTIGVVRARHIAGEGSYEVFDLVPRASEWGRMCKACSKAQQRPVYHTKENTKCGGRIRARSIFMGNREMRQHLQQPDQDRILGPQVPKQKANKDGLAFCGREDVG